MQPLGSFGCNASITRLSKLCRQTEMQAKVTSPSGSDAGKHARSRLMMTDSQNHMRQLSGVIRPDTAPELRRTITTWQSWHHSTRQTGRKACKVGAFVTGAYNISLRGRLNPIDMGTAPGWWIALQLWHERLTPTRGRNVQK